MEFSRLSFWKRLGWGLLALALFVGTALGLFWVNKHYVHMTNVLLLTMLADIVFFILMAWLFKWRRIRIGWHVKVDLFQILKLLVFSALAALIWEIFMNFFITGEPRNQEVLLREAGKHSFWLFAVFAVGIAPIVEEFLFRGILFNAFPRKWPTVALFGSSALFGLFHGPESINTFFLYAGLGVMFGTVYKEKRSLFFSVLAHGACNAMALAALFLR